MVVVYRRGMNVHARKRFSMDCIYGMLSAEGMYCCECDKDPAGGLRGQIVASLSTCGGFDAVTIGGICFLMDR